MKQTVLCCGVSPREEQRLAARLRPHGLAVYTVDRAQYTTPLDVILGLRKPERVLPPLGFELAEPMLVLHGLSEAQLDALLAELKAADIRIALKAVTTPTNLRWSPMQLYAELKRERAAFLERQRR